MFNNFFNDKVHLNSIRKLTRNWLSPQRQSFDEYRQNTAIWDRTSKYGLNEVVADLKRKSPEAFVRWKCEFYDSSRHACVVSSYKNSATDVSSCSSISIDDDKYSALEKDIAELNKQVAFLLRNQAETSKRPTITTRNQCQRPKVKHPPAPPPTPRLPRGETIRRLSEEYENRIREKSEIQICADSENRIRKQMTGVLQNLQSGKESLKPISQSSPNKTPRQSFIKSRSQSDFSSGSIAEALKKKFANVEFDSPQNDCDSSFTQTFDDSFSEDDSSFSTRFRSLDLQNSKKLTVS